MLDRLKEIFRTPRMKFILDTLAIATIVYIGLLLLIVFSILGVF